MNKTPSEKKSQTRAQQQLIFAADRVQRVASKGEDVKNIYGGMCHKFPVLVRTCGLCQAIVFLEAKKASANADRKQAHTLLLEHLGELIHEIDPQASSNVVEAIRTADTLTYIRYTRQILAAWIYFKRFAVSILEIDNGQIEEDNRPRAIGQEGQVHGS